MGYHEIEFANSWIREDGIRKIIAIKYYDPFDEPSLVILTDDTAVNITISTYEQTKEDLDRELALTVESVRTIRAVLEYFDEKWDEIEEFVNKPTAKREGQSH
jgi:hypothetical protein